MGSVKVKAVLRIVEGRVICEIAVRAVGIIDASINV